jgi:hypothetical protein
VLLEVVLWRKTGGRRDFLIYLAGASGCPFEGGQLQAWQEQGGLQGRDDLQRCRHEYMEDAHKLVDDVVI